MIRAGILGLSEGNGHPYSFSAIVNGYSDEGFAAAGWPVIHDYLKLRRDDEFGFDDVRVTHAWTQEPEETAKLCRATRIDHAVPEPTDMLGAVDVVIIARDDWQTHLPLSQPFLDAGLNVFIDKPLTLDVGQLDYFRPYLEAGRLMSCSGLRFARELDGFDDIGAVRAINGTVVMDWQRYGVHLLDAVFASVKARPVSVAKNPASHDSFTLAMDDGSVFSINAIGSAHKTFRLDVFGEKRNIHIDMHDNFSAFRATLKHFFDSCRSGQAAIDSRDTLRIMQTLIAGLKAEPGGAHVKIGEVSTHGSV